MQTQESQRPIFVITFDFSKDDLKNKLSEFNLDQIEITSVNDSLFTTKLCDMQPEKVFIDGRIPMFLKLEQLLKNCITYSKQDKFELKLYSFSGSIDFTEITHIGDFNELKNALKSKQKIGQNA